MSKSKKLLETVLYWAVQLTWGAWITLPGLLVGAFCVIFLKGKPHKNGYGIIIEIGGNWGGFNLGAISLCGHYATVGHPCYNPDWFDHTRRHEFGHSVQNLITGPFTLFWSTIPSVIRYWYQTLRRRKGLQNVPYDQAIFEYTASSWGYYWINHIDGSDKPYQFIRQTRGK